MSKINAVRLINCNYNNNAIRISDETFRLNGESTLLSLRNGGGKSVLVQMITAPFVHKRYRDTKDRPFQSYFTTPKPTFIFVEWVLDRGAGYVLTGMMVRKSQEIDEGGNDGLDIINIISEYKKQCIVDINNIPVVERVKKGINLKSFAACRQLFESYKKDREYNFFCYDMSNQAQARQYFDKLTEYQINYKEWENIIKKVNLKESGLSELFADCRDEKGLVDKWLLDAVENKLNKDKNMVAQFQTIIVKYAALYKDNKSKIKRRDIINLFKEEGEKIRNKAGLCLEADRVKCEQENRIANFILRLRELKSDADEECENAESKIAETERSIAHIAYEKLSYELYGMEKEWKSRISNKDLIGMERDSIQRETDEIERSLNLMKCAKQQEDKNDKKKDLDVVREQLNIYGRKNASFEPERKALGYILRCYYEKETEKNQNLLRENEAAYQKCTEEESDVKSGINDMMREINGLSEKKGGLTERIRMFDDKEDIFNKKYNEKFQRNIMGEYEPGMLDIRKREYENECEAEAGKLRQLLKRKKDCSNNTGRLERQRESLVGKRMKITADIENEEALKKNYEDELQQRKIIMRYLELDEQYLFDEEKIISVSSDKLKEIYVIRKKLEIEEDALKKELKRLNEGGISELGEELVHELEDLGIHITYGMEWLKKNGFNESKNLEIVRSNPFLPYSLILSDREINLLSQNCGNVYTSFPIPIVKREQLESGIVEENEKIVRLGDIRFYVLFNENLLNEEKLRMLINEKESVIERKKEAIEIKNREYNDYSSRCEKIKNQKVNKENYNANTERLRELYDNQKSNEEDFAKTLAELDDNKKNAEKLDRDIQDTKKYIDYQNRRKDDYTQFCDEYEQYDENRNELQKCIKSEKRLTERMKMEKDHLDSIGQEMHILEAKKDELIRERDKLHGELVRYLQYTEKGSFDTDLVDVQKIQARFLAITSEVSRELAELESQESSLCKKYTEAADDLEHMRSKYGFEQGEWSKIKYNRKEESDRENILKVKKDKLKLTDELWHTEDKNIGIIKSKIDALRRQMQDECGYEEPLPESGIVSRDFDAEKNKLKYELELLRNKARMIYEKIKFYDANLTALAEYTDFVASGPVTWDIDPGMLDSEQLRKLQGILVRDYRDYKDKKRDAGDKLKEILNQIVRREEFADEYYKKPLESMLELVGDAKQVLKQLDTTVQSYDELMQKLEVDISMVEKEKEKIVELLEDYLKDVHENLGKIDSNSTINVRGRSLKMLKITLPEWETNESMYHLKMQEFIDEITMKGVEIFENNENAQEYFGTQITTKNIYDTIIGIGNVRIKLYKIEAQREYPITWAEVAKNSGGEGFLSAFVILSSLLHYMRKDDTDLFADRNEGKVLLMDNPFAQTNASHLLKPLTDMAVKTNTQLICLTGLGGESIYNRFDNIYVINLVASGLHNGMQYVKVNHLKGNEPETFVVSQIEVMEQQELIF